MEAITPAYVDKEITKYTLLLCDLRAQKNSFSPISRLPTETLANIFVLAARDYLYHESSGPFTLRVPNWVNVSYVCRHWRNVALNWPTLWTYHFTASLRWTEELLARSKQAPLKICIRTHYVKSDSWWSSLIEKVLSQAERIEELRLDVSARYFPTGLSLHAPRLQILDIRSGGFTWTVSIKEGDVLPLRTLKLSGCPLPWRSLNLSGITTLVLEQVPASSQQDLGEFLGTLRRMQALTVLHLDRALPNRRGFLTSGASSVSPKVNLPSLARFFIAAPLSTILALLSRTNIPLTAQVWLESTPEANASVNGFADIPSVVSRRFRQSKNPLLSPTIRSLVIRFPNITEPLTICASEHDDYDPCLSTAYPPQDCNVSLMIRVRMEPSIEPYDRDRIICDICRSIPSAHVQVLHVANPTFSFEFWEEILERLEGLRRMKLSEGVMLNLLGLADAEETGDDHDPTLEYTLVPVLEELALHGIGFASDWDESLKDAMSERELRDALSTRKALRFTTTACFVQAEEDEDEDDEEEEEEHDDDDGFHPCQCDECLSYPSFY